MNFKLTSKELDDIVELYGCSRIIILYVENKLNSIGIIENDDEFLRLVISIVFQFENVKQMMKHSTDDIEKVYMSIDEIVKFELKREYENNDYKMNQIQKIYRYIDITKKNYNQN